MRVKYVEEEMFYHISNHAVGCNSLFINSKYCDRFREKLNIYLGPLCEIVEYNFLDNQFQLIVKTASREKFVDYYIAKQKAKDREIGEIPKSTYIFSQAMANLQSSMAIHLNRKEKRTGALFARRFSKTMIKNKKELSLWLNRLAKRVKFHKYYGKWKSKIGKKGIFVLGSRVGDVTFSARRLKEIMRNLSDLESLNTKTSIFIQSSINPRPKHDHLPP